MATTARQTEYVSAADTAKILRKQLKPAFPDVRFSVRSKTYAGGASINVNWVDGPTEDEVNAVVKPYEGGGFDGMIDMKYNRSHYLKPDGSVYVHHDPGTEGSGGMNSGENNTGLERLMPDDVRVVHFGADHIFTRRVRSNQDELMAEAVQFIYDNCHIVGATGDPERDKFGNWWVSQYAFRLVHQQKDGESMADVFARLP